MMKRSLILLSLMLSLTGCAHKSNCSKVRVATLRGPSSVAMIQLIDSISLCVNSDYEIRIYDEPLQVRKLMMEGEVEMAILPSTTAALLYNKGIPYSTAAVPLWGTLSLCGKDSTIQSIRALKGKTVHLMARGMTPDILFRHLLEEDGIIDEVTLDYRFPTHIELANAAAAGLVDFAILSEPYLSQALLMNPSLHRLIDLNVPWTESESCPLAETALVVRNSFRDRNRCLTQEFVEAFAHSSEWVKENPEEASSLSVKYGIIADSSAAVMSIPHSNINVVAIDKAKDALRQYLNVFYNMEPAITGGRMPDEDFYR